MLASTGVESIVLRLPMGDNQTYLLHLSVYIQDNRDAIKRYKLGSVRVEPDFQELDSIIEGVHLLNDTTNDTDLVRAQLADLDPNIQSQVLTSLLTLMNAINAEMIETSIQSSCFISIEPYISDCLFSLIDGLSSLDVAVPALDEDDHPSVGFHSHPMYRHSVAFFRTLHRFRMLLLGMHTRNI